eukprot:Pompholyxophrys_punicea_v1_NODE_910_length_1147_cov_2.264652.p2 type:complete len:101 gc:universal NODE_910_length_1147_cov_2.264652:666-968(+)
MYLSQWPRRYQLWMSTISERIQSRPIVYSSSLAFDYNLVNFTRDLNLEGLVRVTDKISFFGSIIMSIGCVIRRNHPEDEDPYFGLLSSRFLFSIIITISK